MADIKKYASISSLQSLIDNIKLKFAALVHTHKLSDITDYIVDDELSPTSTNPIQNKTVSDEFDAVAEAMGLLQNNIYTKVEIDALELISIDDIDTICNATIVAATDVAF